MVIYKLGLPLSTKIFNFNQFVNTMNLAAFLWNPEILPCNGDGLSYADKYHTHILTGIYVLSKTMF